MKLYRRWSAAAVTVTVMLGSVSLAANTAAASTLPASSIDVRQTRSDLSFDVMLGGYFPVSIVNNGWKMVPPLGTLFVASGNDYPDALAGAALAGKDKTAVILTDAQGSAQLVAPEMYQSSLGVQQVVILGGSAAVSDETAQTFRDDDLTVTRVAGTDRYDTAALIATKGWGTDAPTVYLASGQKFADALAAGDAGASNSVPVLLTDPNSLPSRTQQELASLHTKTVDIIGGTAAVSDAVYNKLASLGYQVSRIAGVDRYDTAMKVAQQLFAQPPSSCPPDTSEVSLPAGCGAVLVDGGSYQAALIVSAAAGERHEPLLLRPANCTPRNVEQFAAARGYSEVKAWEIGPASDEGPPLYTSPSNDLYNICA